MALKSYPDEVDFTHDMSQVTLRLLDLTFEEAALEYRRIEAKYLARAGISNDDILEIRRRTIAQILGAALGNEQTYEVCQTIWKEMSGLGFFDLERKYTMTAIYARCCQMNGEFDAALELVDSLIPEIAQQGKDATPGSEMRAHCVELLGSYQKIRDELKAGVRE